MDRRSHLVAPETRVRSGSVRSDRTSVRPILLSCTQELEAPSTGLLVDTIGKIMLGAVTRYAPMTPKPHTLRR